MIIGFSGYARAGKDEAAKVLAEYDYRRVAFADKLRDFLYALNPDVWSFSPGFGRTYTPLRKVIDQQGWEGVKKYQHKDSVRELLQRLGTEAGRQHLGENVWVDAALTGVSTHDKVVVTDVRFENEANAIKKRGGIVVRVNREGNGPAVGSDGKIHKSETGLDRYDFDYFLTNAGTKEEYRDHVRAFMEQLDEALYFKHVIGD